MNQSTQSRLKIPAHFSKPNGFESSGLILYMLSMLCIPTALNYYLFFISDMDFMVAAVFSLPLFLLSGQAFHLMGWIGHDGFHFALHSNRLVSAIIGIFVSSMSLLFFNVGMAMDHWAHHRFANSDKDPDVDLLSHHRKFWARMLLQRARANRHYFHRTMMYAMNRPLPKELLVVKLPFRYETFHKLAIFNLLSVIFWIGVYLAINSMFPGIIWIMVVIPMFIGAWLSGLRSFVEHNNTEEGYLKDTRSRTHWFFTLFEAGGNYHLEHHMYPNVPQWRLPGLHQWLRKEGAFAQLDDPGLIDPNLSVYRYASSKYRYGKKDEPLESVVYT